MPSEGAGGIALENPQAPRRENRRPNAATGNMPFCSTPLPIATPRRFRRFRHPRYGLIAVRPAATIARPVRIRASICPWPTKLNRRHVLRVQLRL